MGGRAMYYVKKTIERWKRNVNFQSDDVAFLSFLFVDPFRKQNKQKRRRRKRKRKIDEKEKHNIT